MGWHEDFEDMGPEEFYPDDRDYPEEYWDDEEDLIDGVGFQDPGGRSALRAATPDNPRVHPCPTCGEPNRLTNFDVRRGYQCDACKRPGRRRLVSELAGMLSQGGSVHYHPDIVSRPVRKPY